MTDDHTFADALLLARAETGTTVEDLAELVGVTPAAVEGFERGAAFPTVNVAVSLAGVLALDVFDLLALVYG